MPVVPNTYRGSREHGLAYAALIVAAHTAGMITCEGIATLIGLRKRGAGTAKCVNRMRRRTGKLSLGLAICLEGIGLRHMGN